MADRVTAKVLDFYLTQLKEKHPLPEGLEYQLTNAPHYGGWALQICHLNEGGGVSLITNSRLSPKEMKAFLRGALHWSFPEGI